jgi:hypothetical protein
VPCSRARPCGALRGAVDRRGEPTRAAADDREVVDVVVERLADPERSGELGVRRILEDQLAAPGDDRRLVGLHAETVEQVRHVRILLEVEERVEDAVAREEVADAERIVPVPRADHARAGESLGVAQELPPRDEGLEDHVSDRWALIDDLPQRLRVDREHVAVGLRHGARDRRPADGLAQLAGEVPRPVDDDGARLFAELVADLDLPFPDDKERDSISRGEDPFAGGVMAGLRVRAARERFHLRLGQLREGDGLEVGVGDNGFGHAR